MQQIEGRNPVIEAFRAGQTINKIMMAKGEARGPLGQIQRLAKEHNVPVQMVERKVMDQYSETGHHQGVIAQVSAVQYWELKELLAHGRTMKQPLYLVLDGIQDPHNLGSLLRSAEAAGAVGVIIPQRRAVGVTPVAAKASAGASSHIPVCRVPNIARALETLKDEGCWVCGADMEGDLCYDKDLTVPLALVIGGEGRGLGHAAKKQCDFLVRVPMLGKVNSLNASVAGAVVLFEVVRQRAIVGEQ